MDATEAQLRARGYSPADIAYVLRTQKLKQQPLQMPSPSQPTQPQPKRARDSKTAYDFIVSLLRGHGM